MTNKNWVNLVLLPVSAMLGIALLTNYHAGRHAARYGARQHDLLRIAVTALMLLPAVGLEAFAVSGATSGEASGLNGQELLSRVDRVLYNSEDGVARTTLVKFLPTHR